MGRLLLIACAALVLSAPAWADNMGDRKRALDNRIAALQGRIQATNAKEAVLTDEIEAVTGRIRALQDDVDRAQARVTTLENELVVYKNRLARLSLVLELQTQQLKLLTAQHEVAQRRLDERLVAIYQAESPDAVEVLLTAESLAEVLDRLDYIQDVGRQDKQIAARVRAAKLAMRRTRARTAATRKQVAATTAAVEARTNEQRVVRDRLVAGQNALASARADKRETLGSLRSREAKDRKNVENLQRESAEIGARIRAAQSSPSAVPLRTRSSSGFIWPTSGTLTSGFGWRWGRMHEGIDIAAPTGTPIAAAASGTVIYAGWMGGYGNLVVIDHGGGLATAYGHQSSIGTGVGAQVSQGQTIGYVGSTGHSTGPHVHFEVRVNGVPVDPLGYL
ncbi:MAG TPA: peptidoglycan DD-metalloendopeptidase family protein [Gaiellaceae bacterium]|nr:peptidoglycan DD-metalloendopeptidase family protein [Gaiellaceae bacterium]